MAGNYTLVIQGFRLDDTNLVKHPAANFPVNIKFFYLFSFLKKNKITEEVPKGKD
jgi:hypothetical protein